MSTRASEDSQCSLLRETWRPLGTRWRALAAFGALPVLLAATAPAEASEINRLRAEVTDLEQQARGLEVRYRTQAATHEQLAEHRLVDAQVLYTLKDYSRAAILLLDYVNRYKDTRGYPEAVYYLADSLYYKRDYLSSRRYFRLIVNKIRGRYYQEALQRLVELSLLTGDSSEIEIYLAALAGIPPAQLKSSVPYVRGKYFFFKKRTDEAIAAFRAITPGQKYYVHAQYFIGVALVRKKDKDGAMRVFRALLQHKPASANERHVIDLTYLALGRLLYEKGKTTEAIDMYQKVSRRSPEFDTVLYEICWAYVKANEYNKALRALELLALAHPDSPVIPDVRVLQGNLLIRLDKFGPATEHFTKTREQFLPAYSRMKQLMAEHADSSAFFEALIARNARQMETSMQVPSVAVSWVESDSKVKRALNLVSDVREIQTSLKEAGEVIAQLERALGSPAKIKVFPEFAAAKAKSLEVENRLLLARQGLIERERALVAGAATAGEREQLREMADRRAELERRIKELPTTAEGYETRQRGSVGRVAQLEAELSRLAVQVENLQAQIVAAEKYFEDTAGARKPDVRESFRRELESVRALVGVLQYDVDSLRQGLADAKSMGGVGGPDEVAERSVKTEYRQALSKEHQLLASIRERLSGRPAADFDTVAGLLGRCDQVDSVLEAFDRKLDAGIEEKLTTVRTELLEEKAHLAGYLTETAECKTSTDEVASKITYEGFRDVAHRFYEIIVRSDVGIIDVAWALKDSKTKEVSRVVRQQKMDLKLLDDEFKEVLAED